jgi:hypothetical protein
MPAAGMAGTLLAPATRLVGRDEEAEAISDLVVREGVRLVTAAMLQARGSGWLHAYVPRAAHDDGVRAVLRTRLGDAAFAKAWAWGGSIGGRNAVDYALETG